MKPLLLYGAGWLVVAGWMLYRLETDEDVPLMVQASREWWPLLALGAAVFWPVLVGNKIVKQLTGKGFL